jgi:predicted deacetylase
MFLAQSIRSESSWSRKVTRQHPFNLWTSGIHNNNKRKNVHPACVCSESGFRSYVWLVSEETVPLCSAAQKIGRRKEILGERMLKERLRNPPTQGIPWTTDK